MNVPEPRGVVLVLLCGALVAVVISDVRHRTIPNGLVAVIGLAGLVHSLASGGLPAVLASLAGAAVGATLLLWQFARGFMGGGDVKLLGALGSWAGAAGSVYIFVLGSIFGGVLAVASLVRMSRTERRDVLGSLAGLGRGGAYAVPAPPALAPSRSRGIPYGVALAAAGAVILSLGGGR